MWRFVQSVISNRVQVILGILWASPCSLVGIALAIPLFCLGGTFRRVNHTLEVALVPHQADRPVWASKLPFLGITFGHVILGQSHEVLALLRAHERVHVRQYERLGVFFFLAYPASSLMALLRGQSPYRGNHFEREAFASAPNRDSSQA